MLWKENFHSTSKNTLYKSIFYFFIFPADKKIMLLECSSMLPNKTEVKSYITRFNFRISYRVTFAVFLAATNLALSTAQAAPSTKTSQHSGETTWINTKNVKLQIQIGNTRMLATLNNSPTAHSFAALLPITMTLRDLSTAEKVSDALPTRLSEEGAPKRDMGTIGDIAYYAPWGNIAFYRDEGPDASGVIKIGKIISGLEALNSFGRVTITISLINQFQP
ncbi:cyclophilin-like fold protein [Neoasaia chiangmaiensis]|uniref:cyclophilin-like fold protein n=1 Tax=Neoasaia chiangmaiensis TaxID=320497 RepID=UPI001B8014EB|nr:cyclophilin-like fold protein [Neoasaia chiangmaiensis]